MNHSQSSFQGERAMGVPLNSLAVVIELLSSSLGVVIVGGVTVLVFMASYLSLAGSRLPISRKAQQAKAMRKAFDSLDQQSVNTRPVRNSKEGVSSSSMTIGQLWVYPIKSLRGCSVSQALMTAEGFYLDRRFVLLQDDKAPGKLKHMAISRFSNMCLFHTSITGNKIIVSYRPPGISEADATSIDIPLIPESFENLKRVDINMHYSPNKSFDMGDRYSKFFSDIYGFKVILAHWGDNPRAVLGNLPGKPTNQGPDSKNGIAKIFNHIPLLGPLLASKDAGIAFNDCAPYLVISESSVADTTSRLPEGVEMDSTKFRANIILSTTAPAFAEDFWGELTFNRSGPRIILTGNCGRCKSLNVDYNTGESGTGKDGKVLSLLSKDRRVDAGVKYSPIFGRYGFVSKGAEGSVLKVGDEVSVSRRNEERTRFYWPGLST